MNDIVDQFKFALQVVWENAKYQAGDHVILVVAVVVAVLVLVWIFFLGGARRKGY